MAYKNECKVYSDSGNDRFILNIENYEPSQDVNTYFYDKIELIYIEYGLVRVEIENKIVEISEDEIVFIPPLVQYSMKIVSKSKIIRVLVPIIFLSEFNSLLNEKTLPTKMDDKSYNRDCILKLLEILEDLISNEKILQNLSEKGFINLLVGSLISRYDLVPNKRQDIIFLDKTNKYIHDNYKTDISIDEIAKEVGYNRTYFSRMFHTKIGITLRDYINNIRLQKFVERYSEQNMNKTKILDLIFDCGFGSVSTFYRVFNRFYKTTPSKYFNFSELTRTMKKDNNMGYKDYCRKCVPEGIVILEHDGMFPLKQTDCVALFGRSQLEYLAYGTGSGGNVNSEYISNIVEGLDKKVKLEQGLVKFYRDYAKENPLFLGDDIWGHPHKIRKEPIFSDEYIKSIAKTNQKAIFVLGRFTGESYDDIVEPGYWYLSKEEEQTISQLSKHFSQFAVLINSGNIMDMSWVKKYGVKNVMYIWQGGQEGGNGTVDALMGDNPPSGRLSDTIAENIKDYPAYNNFGSREENVHVEDIYVGYRYFETFAPEKVLYPFGYGLSYAEFSVEYESVTKNEQTITFESKVKNIGKYAGKEVVQVYFSAPNGKLGKPKKELIAFKKTDLLKPGEEQRLFFCLDVKDMASYDDEGKSGYPSCFVLESGEYTIVAGKSVRDTVKILEFIIDDTQVVKQCKKSLSPNKDFEKIYNVNGKPKRVLHKADGSVTYDNIKEVKELSITGDKGITLKQVKNGEYGIEEFVAQLSVEELSQLVKGEGMSSYKAPQPGTAGCIGGLTSSLAKKGIPIVTVCDGPTGLRMSCAIRTHSFPIATMIGCSFNPSAYDGVYEYCAYELKENMIDGLLAPGMNIHRHPLGGRNWEYFSEDPVLTGEFAKNESIKLREFGIHGTLKHFAVNSQEYNRTAESEVVSERALREIFLRPFEIAVKGGSVGAIMTSYNRVNGQSTSAYYDLTTRVLREEWGYDGLVMTDWWTKMDDPRTKTHSEHNIASMIKAQNDVFMVVKDTATYEDDVIQSIESGYLSIGELQRSAINVLKYVMSCDAFDRETDNAYIEGFKNERVFYTDKVRDKISVDINAGVYFGEIEYSIDGATTDQHVIPVQVDDYSWQQLILSGTNKKIEKFRFKIGLNKGSKITIKSDNVVSFAIYE